jgi:F-type H+-transporting ATPase subunit b
VIDRIKRGILPLAAGVLHALPALAADEGPGATHSAEEVAHEAAHGSPSLFSVEPGLMVWTAVTFLVVLLVLRFTAWGPLMKSLAERQRSIEGAIEEARRTKTEAEALLAKYETMLESARDEARAILDESRKDGLKVQEEIRARAQHEAEEFKARAHREIDLAKEGALKEIWDSAAGLSTELANRILGRTIQASDQDRLVRELIEEMRGELAKGDGRPGTENA